MEGWKNIWKIWTLSKVASLNSFQLKFNLAELQKGENLRDLDLN